MKLELEELIEGNSINNVIDDSIVMSEVEDSNKNIWSFLLMSGYLKAVNTQNIEGRLNCELKIPNKEVLIFYKNLIEKWFQETMTNQKYEFKSNKESCYGRYAHKEFDSEFCNVKFIAKDKAVFLTWKKFACGYDYRKPTTFAWELLKGNVGSNFIVDARNGFEDEKADTDWGFSVLLLPNMAQTTCKIVCFIMNEVNEIEEEMDMWTKEFGKYFAVIKAFNYENALEKMKRLLIKIR